MIFPLHSRGVQLMKKRWMRPLREWEEEHRMIHYGERDVRRLCTMNEVDGLQSSKLIVPLRLLNERLLIKLVRRKLEVPERILVWWLNSSVGKYRGKCLWLDPSWGGVRIELSPTFLFASGMLTPRRTFDCQIEDWCAGDTGIYWVYGARVAKLSYLIHLNFVPMWSRAKTPMLTHSDH